MMTWATWIPLGPSSRALPCPDHALCRFAPDEEAGEAADPPAALELDRIGLAHRAALIGTDIEDDKGRRGQGALGLVEKPGHLARRGSIAVHRADIGRGFEFGAV